MAKNCYTTASGGYYGFCIAVPDYKDLYITEHYQESPHMKRKQHNEIEPKDTPSTRKRRMQSRLKELSERSDRELAILMTSIEKMKANLRNNKKR